MLNTEVDTMSGTLSQDDTEMSPEVSVAPAPSMAIESMDAVPIPTEMKLKDIMSMAKDLTARANYALSREDEPTAGKLLERLHQLRTNYSPAFDKVSSIYTAAGLYGKLSEIDPLLPADQSPAHARRNPLMRIGDEASMGKLRDLGAAVGAGGQFEVAMDRALTLRMQNRHLRNLGVDPEFYHQVQQGKASFNENPDTVQDMNDRYRYDGDASLGDMFFRAVKAPALLKERSIKKQFGTSALGNLAAKLAYYDAIKTVDPTKLDWFSTKASQRLNPQLQDELDALDPEGASSEITVQRNDPYSGGSVAVNLSVKEVQNIMANPAQKPDEARQIQEWVQARMKDIPVEKRGALQAMLLKNFDPLSTSKSNTFVQPSAPTIGEFGVSQNAQDVADRGLIMSTLTGTMGLRSPLISAKDTTDATHQFVNILAGAKKRFDMASYLRTNSDNDQKRESHAVAITTAEAEIRDTIPRLKAAASAAGLLNHPEVAQVLAAFDAQTGKPLATATNNSFAPRTASVDKDGKETPTPPAGWKVIGTSKGEPVIQSVDGKNVATMDAKGNPVGIKPAKK